jgi:hypothetical membrane protein
MSNYPTSVRTDLSAHLGALCWVLASLLFFTAHLVVQLAWDPAYSWAHNNISDLGNVTCGPWGDNRRFVCSPLHTWMNVAFVVSGVLFAAGTLLTRSRWGGGIAARVLLLMTAAAWVVVGLYPADVNENVHVLLGAVVIFSCGNVALLFAARRGCPGGLRKLAVILGGVGVVGMGLFFSGHYLGLGMGGMERVTALGVPIWLGASGISAWVQTRTS